MQEIRLLLELRNQREVDIKGTKLFIKRLVSDWLHKKAIAAQARLPQQLPPRPSSLAPAPAPVERRVNMLPLYNCERDSKLAEQFLELGISGFVATCAAEWAPIGGCRIIPPKQFKKEMENRLKRMRRKSETKMLEVRRQVMTRMQRGVPTQEDGEGAGTGTAAGASASASAAAPAPTAKSSAAASESPPAPSPSSLPTAAYRLSVIKDSQKLSDFMTKHPVENGTAYRQHGHGHKHEPHLWDDGFSAEYASDVPSAELLQNSKGVKAAAAAVAVAQFPRLGGATVLQRMSPVDKGLEGIR